MGRTRVLIAEDYAPYREVLSRLIKDDETLDFVGEVSDGRS